MRASAFYKNTENNLPTETDSSIFCDVTTATQAVPGRQTVGSEDGRLFLLGEALLPLALCACSSVLILMCHSILLVFVCFGLRFVQTKKKIITKCFLCQK